MNKAKSNGRHCQQTAAPTQPQQNNLRGFRWANPANKQSLQRVRVDFRGPYISLNFHLAKLAISKKASEIYFLGSTGKRLDHTLGNLGLLLNALNKGVRAQIIDDRNKVFLVNSNFKIYSDDEYKYISFLAYNEEIKEFTIKDAKYTLDKYKLKVGDSRTVSNEFNSNEINIEVSNGNLLVMFSKD